MAEAREHDAKNKTEDDKLRLEVANEILAESKLSKQEKIKADKKKAEDSFEANQAIKKAAEERAIAEAVYQEEQRIINRKAELKADMVRYSIKEIEAIATQDNSEEYISEKNK